MGRKFGVTDQQLRDLSQYEESNAFSQREKLVLDLAVAMTRTPADISNELFEELRKRFSNAQLVELATSIAHANFRARFNRPFNIQPVAFSKSSY